MIQVFNDFISKHDLKYISDDLTFKTPWYFSVDYGFNTSLKQPWSLGSINNKKEFGSIEHYLIQVLNQKGFDTSKIFRSIHNCFRRLDKPQYHQDPGEVSYMFYLNSEWKSYWGAPTKFKAKKYHLSTKVYPKPGRMVMFTSKLWHKGTAPNFLMPLYIPGRFSIVLQEHEENFLD